MISVVSLNINGLNDCTKQTTFIHWLKCLKADIVCLQEMHAASHATFRSWFSNSGYAVASSCISNKCAGMAILVSSKHRLDKVWWDDAGRFVQAEVGIGEQVLCFVSLYAPNINLARNKFFASLPDLMDMCHPTFVCGDFNSVLDPDLNQCHPRSFQRLAPNRSAESLSALQSCCLQPRPFQHGTPFIQEYIHTPGIMLREIALPELT